MFTLRGLKRHRLIQQAKQTSFGRKLSRRYYARVNPAKTLWRLRQLPIKQNLVVYQSADGKALHGNPRAIFDYLVKTTRYSNLRHVWVVDNLSQIDVQRMRSVLGTSKVDFVQYQSTDYYRVISTAHYLINDTTFPHDWGKRPGQIYVNTWHGMALKKIGYDTPQGYFNTRNVLRNLMSADYLVSCGPAMTDVVYRQAFRLDGLYPGVIIESGYPRVDSVLQASPDVVRAQLKSSGIETAGREIILYAPTWRGQTQGSVQDVSAELIHFIRNVESKLDTSSHVLLLRVHPFVYDVVCDVPELAGYLVPRNISTNDLLAATAHLITDYSSVFFDFLPLDRPITFFAPDLEDYRTDRGVYVEPEAWPGPVFQDIDSLTAALADGSTQDVAVVQRRHLWQKQYSPHEDGSSSARVVQTVFEGRADASCLIRGLQNGKTTILIHAGGLLANGITSCLLSLLSLIDYDKYDVSLVYPSRLDQARLRTADTIDPRVRHFPRMGRAIHPPAILEARRRYDLEGPAAAGSHAGMVEESLREEWVRCFGGARFDHVIDFSGYSSFWVNLLLQGSYGESSIWVHSDLEAELETYESGQRPNGKHLRGIFSVLGRFDHIVSVSRQLNEVSTAKLGRYADEDRFTWVTNSIDYDGLIKKASLNEDGDAPVRPDEDLPVPRMTRAGARTPLGREMERLGSIYGWDRLESIAARLSLVHGVIGEDADAKTFVTMGRLSAEKNHARLLRAFAQVRRDGWNALLVVIGAGELLPHLKSLARQLGVADWVTFTGHLENPMPLLVECDCFVMSSRYEGQPMVILEALCLGLPVVSTRFDAVESALPRGVGLVVDQDDAALADGMRAFLRGEVRPVRLDVTDYNRRAMSEFERVIRPRQLDKGREEQSLGSAAAP